MTDSNWKAVILSRIIDGIASIWHSSRDRSRTRTAIKKSKVPFRRLVVCINPDQREIFLFPKTNQNRVNLATLLQQAAQQLLHKICADRRFIDHSVYTGTFVVDDIEKNWKIKLRCTHRSIVGISVCIDDKHRQLPVNNGDEQTIVGCIQCVMVRVISEHFELPCSDGQQGT